MAADISGVLGPGHGTAAGGVGTCCCCLRARMQERKGWTPQGKNPSCYCWQLGGCKGPALERTDRRAIRAGRPMTAERLRRLHRCVRVFLAEGESLARLAPPRAAGAASLIAQAGLNQSVSSVAEGARRQEPSQESGWAVLGPPSPGAIRRARTCQVYYALAGTLT